VPGVEEQSDIGAAQALGKLAHRLGHGVARRVALLDHLEADAAQGLSKIGGVVGWVVEGGNGFIFAVAEHQREAHAGESCRLNGDERRKRA
jgi:hypothetical protein